VPQGDWRKWDVTPLHFRLGDFLGTVVDFLIVSFVVFLVMIKVVGAARRVPTPSETPAQTKACPECLEMVPVAARRCRACTSVLVALALLLVTRSASAQADPKFSHLPIPPGSPAGAAYATGFQPFADKVDTLTEATLIYAAL